MTMSAHTGSGSVSFTPAPVPLATVDAFAKTKGALAPAYAGNPAAIILLPSCAKQLHHENKTEANQEFDEWMLGVAAELNMSMTAFVRPRMAAPNLFEIRWWTPTTEVVLCGHATLAAAHALWSCFGAATPTAPITFESLSGNVVASPSDDGNVVLDFPAEEVTEQIPLDHPDVAHVARGLCIETDQISEFWRNRMDILVVLDKMSTMDAIPSYPDFSVLKTVPDYRVLAVTVQADGEGGSGGSAMADFGFDYDFAARFFAPASGVDEDPVCGSAHCMLGPYWGERLGKTTLVSRVASARGGIVHVGVGTEGGAEGDDRIRLAGAAITTVQGHLVQGLPKELFQTPSSS